MWPAPIKVTSAPAGATFFRTLESGEKIYIKDGKVYAVQP